MNILTEEQHLRLMGWQKQNLLDWELCRRMQDFALQHLDLPIVVMGRNWRAPNMSIDIFEQKTIHEFTAMVEDVKNKIGIEPDKVAPSVGNKVSLEALWKIDGMILRVVVYDAKGCKLHPGHEPVPTIYGKPGKLHPECVSMLESLT